MNLTLSLGLTKSRTPIAVQGGDNPHLAILGRSGSGKSYFLKGLVEQAARQGALCLSLDYSADFRDYVPPNGVTFCHLDATDPSFTINPLAASAVKGRVVAAQQLLGALHSVFRFGPRASVALQKAAVDYMGQTSRPTPSGLLDYMNGLEQKSSGLIAAAEPLELLTTLIHCGNEPISIDLNQQGIVVLGLDHIVDAKLRALLVELILQSVWNQWTVAPNPDRPLILVLDECQNLSWGESSMAVRILREGRKFGVGGWFASQWLDNKTAAAALGQAALRANFRPEDVNIPALAKQLAQTSGTPTQWQKLLRQLKVGQFLYSRRDGKTILVNVPARESGVLAE